MSRISVSLIREVANDDYVLRAFEKHEEIEKTIFDKKFTSEEFEFLDFECIVRFVEKSTGKTKTYSFLSKKTPDTKFSIDLKEI